MNIRAYLEKRGGVRGEQTITRRRWYVSLGGACNVKYQIDQHTHHSQPTLFFDWLMTSFDTVIEVVSETHIENRLHPDTVVKTGVHHRNSVVSIQSLHDCVSIHDLALEYGPEDVRTFLDTYIRRHNRLMEIIKDRRPIYFIRYGEVTPEDASRFVAAVKRIHPSCKFALIVVGDVTAALQNNVVYLRPSAREPLPTDVAWCTPHLAWSEVWGATSSLSLS